MTARRILDLGVERLEEDLVDQRALRGRLRTSVARAYKGLGYYQDAEDLLRQAIDEMAGDPDLTARERLDIQYELADLLFQRGEAAASEGLHDEVLKRRVELFGEDDLDTLESYSILAHKFWRNGDVGAAKEVFDKVLASRREKLGDDHEQTVNVIGSLGTMHFMQGLREEAALYYREAAKLAPTAYGDLSLNTAITISNLAAVTDAPAEREALLEKSLSIRRELLGDDHQLVARAQEILAKFYADQDDATRADDLYRESIATLVRGTELTLIRPTVRVHYGQFLESQQRYDEAISQFETASDEFEQQLGAAHRHTSIAERLAAYTEHLRGNSENAIQRLRRLLALRNPENSADRFVQASVERTLAEVLVAVGVLDEATRHAESAVSIYEIDTEQHRIALAATWAVLAEIALARGDADAAAAHADRAVELAEGDLPQNLARYKSLAGAAQVATGECGSGLDTLYSALAELPDTRAAERDRAAVAARLDEALASCDDDTSLVRTTDADQRLR